MLLPLPSWLRRAISFSTSLVGLLLQETLLCSVLPLSHIELLLKSLQALVLIFELPSSQFELVDQDDQERQEYHKEDRPDSHRGAIEVSIVRVSLLLTCHVLVHYLRV